MLYKQVNPTVAFSESQDKKFDGGLQIDVLAMYEEDFIDSGGREFKATPSFFHAITQNYKDYLKVAIPQKVKNTIKRVTGKDVPLRLAPVIIDHDLSTAQNLRGYVINLRVEEDPNDGASLWARMVILDEDTIQKIRKGLLKEFSIQFTIPEKGKEGEPELQEMSMVLRGAVPGAAVYMSEQREKKLRTELKESCIEFAQDKRTIQKIENNRTFEGKTLKKLDTLVKKGQISMAAKKSLVHHICDLDEKTQDVVFKALQTVGKYTTVKRGHQANVRDAMQVEGLLSSAARGDYMMKEDEKLVKQITKGGKKGTEPATNAKEFGEFFSNLKKSQRELSTLEDENTVKQAAIDEALSFLQSGDTKKATRILAENSETDLDEDVESTISEGAIEARVDSALAKFLSKATRMFDRDKGYEDEKDDDKDDKKMKDKKKKKKEYKKEYKEDDEDEDEKKKYKEDDED